MTDFSTQEADFIKEINNARTNPKSFIPYLKKLIPLFKGLILEKPGETPIETFEGVDAVNDAIEYLQKVKPCSKLILDASLSKAAKIHVDDIGPKGIEDHIGSDGSTPSSRIEKFCQWENTVGENIDFGGKTGIDSVISFIIDDGVEGRGHRVNLFNDAFKVFGVCAGKHKTFERCLVVPFAGGISGKTLNDKENDAPVKPITNGNSKSSSKAINFTEYEKDFLKEINKIRSNPSSYIPLLEERLKFYKGNNYQVPGEIAIETNEGVSAVKEAIKFLKSQKPIPELIENKNLSKASKDHLNDIGPKGLTDHIGSNGSDPQRRIEKYVQWELTNGENIDFGGKSGTDSVISFLVDDGVSSRGHRANMFNKEFKIIGLAAGKHKDYETCLVVNFIGGVADNKAKSKINEDKKVPDRKTKESKEVTQESNEVKAKYELIIDNEDKYKDDKDSFYLSSDRISMIDVFPKSSFTKVSIRGISSKDLTPYLLKNVLSKIASDGALSLVAENPLSVMRKLEAKTLEANLKMAGCSTITINEEDLNGKTVLEVIGSI